MSYSHLMRVPRGPLTIVAIAALLVWACGGGGSTDCSITTGAAITPTLFATAPPSASPVGYAQAHAIAEPEAGLEMALLSDVRAERCGAWDRVTLEFRGGVPGFRASYLAPWQVVSMDMKGVAVLSIVMWPASAQDRSSGEQTFQAPVELPKDLSVIVDASQRSDFEGALTWAIGLGVISDFRVQTVTDPPRLVIEVPTE